jgi:8-oxo-dGTP pyrophosphatase MutT (NUDIX family)
MTVKSSQPATPSPSATLILARRRGPRVEGCLLRRNAASKFMPGTYVFPGGSLVAEDMDIDRLEYEIAS